MDEQATKIVDEIDQTLVDLSARNKRMETYMQITAIATSVIVMAIAGLLLYFIRGVVIVFALAFLMAYILSPAVRFFERRRVNRVLIVSVFYLLFVTGVIISVVLLLPLLWGELRDLQASLTNPEFKASVSARLTDIQIWLGKVFPQLEDIDVGAQFNVEEGISGAASWILDYVGQLMRALTTVSGRLIGLIIFIVIIPFITFFLLKDGEAIKRAAMRIIPGKYSDTSLELLQKVDRQIGRYIRGRLAESIVLSILTIIGLRILNIKYYMVIGGIAGFANLIPYIGPVMIAIPAVILAAYQHGMFRMVMTGAFMGGLQIVDNTILVPLVVGKSVDLHPIVTIFVVIVGGQLLGFLGMIVAVPLTSILIAVFQAVYKEFKSFSFPGMKSGSSTQA